MTIWSFVFYLSAVPLGMTLFNLATWRRGQSAHAPPRGVTVAIPARNEERNISGVIESVVGLDDADCIEEILLYDDGSTDATARCVRAWAARDSRVRLLDSVPLPPGWVGKPHACHRLFLEARSDYLLFVDADVRLHKGALGRLGDLAERSGARVVTAVPRQVMESFVERLVLPFLHLTYTAWLPLIFVGLGRNPSLVAANGQLLFLARRDLESLGGFSAVRAEIVDDVAFCRLAKVRGLKVLFADGFHLASCRMYRGAAEVWRGFSKNLFEGLGTSVPLLVAVVSVYLASFVLPYAGLVWGWLAGDDVILRAATGGVICNLALRAALLFRFRHPIDAALLHPVGAFLLCVIALNSLVWVLRGRVLWAGRSYPPRGRRALSPKERVDMNGKRRFVQWLARGHVRRRLERSFLDVRAYGMRHLVEALERGPVLVASNHVAWWDPLVLVHLDAWVKSDGYCLMDRDSLSHLPFFGWLGAVGIDRSSSSHAHRDLLSAARLLNAPGRLLVVFPQGEQRPAHLPLRFHGGIAWLHKKSGAPIVPMALRYDFLNADRAVVHLVFGRALIDEAPSGRRLVRKLEGAVREQLDWVDNHSSDPGAPFVSLLGRKIDSHAAHLPLGTGTLRRLATFRAAR